MLRFGLLLQCFLLATPAQGLGGEIVVAGQVLEAGGPVARARGAPLPFLPPHEEGKLTLPGGLEPPLGTGAAGALSDARGSFRIVAPVSGMWRLAVQAPGFVPMEYPLAPLTEEIDLPPVELLRDAGIEVKVLDEKGKPVAGAKVLVS